MASHRGLASLVIGLTGSGPAVETELTRTSPPRTITTHLIRA